MMGAVRVLTVPVVLAGAAGLFALVTGSAPGAANSRSSVVDDAAEGDGELVARSAVGYRRGRPVKLRLVTLGWAEVELRTARAFLAMQAEAARSGIELWINSGFRSHEQQAWLYRAWREGWGNRAARPGYSNHQSGRALDLDVRDPATFSWLERHARRFGFRRTIAREPWHWEYVRRPGSKSKRAATSRARRPD
jgi:D-alanyl-D-alanine carboxypeptidase